MVRESWKAAVVAAVISFALGAIAPSALAQTECHDLAGVGTACTTGDPTTGHFGVRVQVAERVNLCIVIFERCP